MWNYFSRLKVCFEFICHFTVFCISKFSLFFLRSRKLYFVTKFFLYLVAKLCANHSGQNKLFASTIIKVVFKNATEFGCRQYHHRRPHLSRQIFHNLHSTLKWIKTGVILVKIVGTTLQQLDAYHCLALTWQRIMICWKYAAGAAYTWRLIPILNGGNRYYQNAC